jgi:uncharacterized protein YciI
MNRYLVLALRRPDFDPAQVQPHRDFLAALREQGRLELAGPFGEGAPAGGAYLLRAADLAEARAIAGQDPAHTSGGWDITVHEWHAK